MTDEILALAEKMTGGRPEEAELLALLCAAAEKEVLARLRPDQNPEACREACLCAAAWLAAAGVLAGRAVGGGGSFTVGEVSLRESEGGDTLAAAQALRRQAWQLLRPYCRDEGFAFRETAG